MSSGFWQDGRENGNRTGIARKESYSEPVRFTQMRFMTTEAAGKSCSWSEEALKMKGRVIFSLTQICSAVSFA